MPLIYNDPYSREDMHVLLGNNTVSQFVVHDNPLCMYWELFMHKPCAIRFRFNENDFSDKLSMVKPYQEYVSRG